MTFFERVGSSLCPLIPLVYVSAFRDSSQPIKSLLWLPSLSSVARVKRVAQRWRLMMQNTDRRLVWMIISLRLVRKKLLEPWEAAFCLIIPPPHSQMFSDQVKATRKSSGREEPEMALGRCREHAFQRSSPNHCPRDWPLESTYLRPILYDRARNLKTFRTSKQIFRSIFPF